MGRALLVVRLAARGLRRRPAEAALLLLAMTAATATLTLGLVLHGVTDDPYQRPREATAGPDVVASVGAHLDRPAELASLEALADAPGVVDHSGPYPVVRAELEVDGVTASTRAAGGEVVPTGVWAVGRDPAAAAVDQPELSQGGWVRDGGVVVEAGFADALGLDAGDEVTLRTRLCGEAPGEQEGCRVVTGRSFRVAGVAVTAAAAPYPDVCFAPVCGRPPGGSVGAGEDVPPPADPGLVWLTEADARSLAPAEGYLSHVVNLRLGDPAAAEAFVDAHITAMAGAERGAARLDPWQLIRDEHDDAVQDQQEVLRLGSRLVALLAAASVSVLAGGRMADQTRRVGLLKAVGATPGLVAAGLLAEYVVLAVLAAAAGLAVGWLAAPALAEPGAGLLGAAGAPSVTLSTVGAVTAVALGVAALATVVPAVRAARTSAVRALADAPRPPRRTPRVTAVSARLPVPLLLGLRVAARRPRRVVLSAVSIAVTVSGIVLALAAHATIERDAQLVGAADPSDVKPYRVLLVLTVTLVVLAAVNAVFVTWATALDARHSSALARALGATPQQVGAGLSAAQVLPALAGAALGLAGGLALLAALGADEMAGPPPWQLLAVVPGTVLVTAALTAVPARLGARRPAAEVLRAELA